MRLRFRLYVSELRGKEVERRIVVRGMICTGHLWGHRLRARADAHFIGSQPTIRSLSELILTG